MDAVCMVQGEITKDDLTFQMPADKRIWGTGYPRPSAITRVTGGLDYGADMALKLSEKPLYLAITQANVSHADILAIDTSTAQNMPGVHKILTHKDINGSNRIFNPMNMADSKSDGPDRPILCDEKVFQYDDAIAVICAESEHEARAAAAKVKVELKKLPANISLQGAMAPNAMEIHPGTPNVYFKTKNIKGMETGSFIEGAPYVGEDIFCTQRQPHMPIEPDVGLAYTDPEGTLAIYTKSMALHLHHLIISKSLGIAPEKLALANPPGVGATFGYKISITSEVFLGMAALATDLYRKALPMDHQT